MNLIDNLQNFWHKIEELRLIYGKKLENFFITELRAIGENFAIFFRQKFSGFLCCILAALASIYLGSIRDIGSESADFLLKLMTIIAKSDFLANCPLFSVKNLLIGTILLVNFLGIFSLKICTKILTKTRISKDQIVINILLICFACSFFLRGISLQLNDILRASSFVLMLTFPLFCLQLVNDKSSNRFRNLVAQISLPLFLIFLSAILLPLFAQIKTLESLDYQSATAVINLFFKGLGDVSLGKFSELFAKNLLPILAFIILTFRLIKSDFLLKKCLLLSLAGLLILLLNFKDSADQNQLFYSLSLPLIALAILSSFRHNLIDFRKNFLLILLVFIAVISDANFFNTCWQLLLLFWFLLPLIHFQKWQEFFKIRFVNMPSEKKISASPSISSGSSDKFRFNAPEIQFKNRVQKNWDLYRPKILISCFIFYGAAFIAILSINEDLAILLAGFGILCYLALQQKLYNQSRKAGFSSFSVFFLSLVAANFLCLIVQAFTMTGVEGRFATRLKLQNEELASNFLYFKKEGQRALILSNKKSDIQPIQIYLTMLEKSGAKPDFNHNFYPQNFDFNNKNLNKFSEVALAAVQDSKIGVLFFFDNDPCAVSLRELLLRNYEFSKIFSQNFVFANMALSYEIVPPSINFLQPKRLTEEEKFALNDNGSVSILNYRFAVYKRKEATSF